MASLQDLAGTADEVLALFAAQLKAQGVQLPERQHRVAGAQPAWDGEQLTVNLMGIGQGQPGHGYGQTIMPPQTLVFYASFSINLVREISTVDSDGFADGEVPSTEDQDTDGDRLISDAQALVLAAAKIYADYALTGVGEGFVIDGLQPVGPEGGLAGSRMLVSVSLS